MSGLPSGNPISKDTDGRIIKDTICNKLVVLDRIDGDTAGLSNVPSKAEEVVTLLEKGYLVVIERGIDASGSPG